MAGGEGRFSLEELRRWLEEDDAKGRDWRVRRLQDLHGIMPIPQDGLMRHIGGTESLICFDEVRRCYMDGSDLAVVLLCLAYVERELAARLYMAGWEPAKTVSLARVLDKALADGWITREERATFRGLAHLRNSYAHFRAPLSETTLPARSVDEDVPPNEELANDARQAVKAMGQIVKRQFVPPFAPGAPEP